MTTQSLIQCLPYTMASIENDLPGNVIPKDILRLAFLARVHPDQSSTNEHEVNDDQNQDWGDEEVDEIVVDSQPAVFSRSEAAWVQNGSSAYHNDGR